MNDSKCKHDGCNCSGSETGNDGYCSAACRDGQSENGACACGHPGCK